MCFETKFRRHILSVSVYLTLIILVRGITFEQDINLSMDQKKLLDKVRTFFGSICKNHNLILSYFEQFKQRVIDRLPHEYMKKEIYLIKWLRCEMMAYFSNDLYT